MNKRTRCFIGFLFLGVLSLSLFGAKVPDEGWDYVSWQSEKRLLERAGLDFPDSGNAAELYYPYLSQGAWTLDRQSFDKVPMDEILAPSDEAQKEKINNLAGSVNDDLAAIMEASGRKEYVLWGVYWTPDPKKTPLAVSVPEYMDLAKLSCLIIFQGKQLEKEGDYDKAEMRYLSAARTGLHLQRDPLALAFIHGARLCGKAATAMSSLEKLRGNDEAGEKWQDLAEYMNRRAEVSGGLLSRMQDKWGRERTELFVKDTDMAYPLRLDCLVENHYCLKSTAACKRCRLTGPPLWVRQLEDELKWEDPQAEIIMALLKNRAEKETCGYIKKVK
jgi:hypothetical protein